MDAEVKSASVVVTCMEAANETEQVGNEFRHHRRGSSSASSHSSFETNRLNSRVRGRDTSSKQISTFRTYPERE